MEEKYINELINLSKKSLKKSEVPIAALIIDEKGKIISKAYNTRNIKQQTINHAEILVITKANKKLKSWRLNNCTLYVTIEPCDMCKSVIKESRIQNVYYLLPRLPEKNQYNKTIFNKLKDMSEKEDKYQEIINKFWKNKRKMI
ncbi:cytidine and deoxycytidylate deaminase zinc-binding region [Clostridium sp. CAG:533]|nr:cytidine and deoxycytidylate deaminase zinc-binding region [Clostridium sp. CAG:533]